MIAETKSESQKVEVFILNPPTASLGHWFNLNLGRRQCKVGHVNRVSRHGIPIVAPNHNERMLCFSGGDIDKPTDPNMS